MSQKTENTSKDVLIQEWDDAHKYLMAEDEYVGIAVGKAESQSEYVISTGVMAPGAFVPNHYHKWEDQTFHVIEGELAAKIGDHIAKVGPGATIHCPRGVPHYIKNIGDHPARMISYIFPGHWAEDFFSETSRQNKTGNVDFRLIEDRFGVVYLPNPQMDN